MNDPWGPGGKFIASGLERLHVADKAVAITPKRACRGLASPVVSIRVRPDAWAVALALAGGDARRLRVVAESVVIVVNQPTRSRRQSS